MTTLSEVILDIIHTKKKNPHKGLAVYMTPVFFSEMMAQVSNIALTDTPVSNDYHSFYERSVLHGCPVFRATGEDHPDYRVVAL